MKKVKAFLFYSYDKCFIHYCIWKHLNVFNKYVYIYNILIIIPNSQPRCRLRVIEQHAQECRPSEPASMKEENCCQSLQLHHNKEAGASQL